MAPNANNDDKKGSATFDSLQHELIEARNLAIKTDNLVKNLGADIKQIAKRQDSYQRKYIFNSAVAYVVFSVLIFTGVYLVYDTRVTSYEREVAHYQSANEQLQERLDVSLAELERRRQSEDSAYAFFELIQSGRREEVVEQFGEVQAQLSDRAMVELLRDRVEEISYGLADEAYREGLTWAQNEQWSDARDAFLDSLNRVERTPWSPELHFNLGLALNELADYEGALHYLDEALASQELDEAHSASARYTRALALESTGRLAEAIEGFRDFRSNHPYHRNTNRALHNINRIQRVIDRSEQD